MTRETPLPCLHSPQVQAIAGAAVILAFVLCFISFTVDDAFISFRYARNLIDYGIWNWNPDRDYVEAYTSALYTFLAIMPYWLHISLPLFFKAFGLMLFARMLWRLHSFCPDARIRRALTAFLILNPRVYVHCLSCLETPLFIVLSLELYYCLTSASLNVRAFYSLLFLLPFTRPEGAILSLMAAGYYVRSVRGRPTHLCTLALVIALGLSYLLWRWHYFGYVLPNTFYAKMVPELTPSLVVARLLDIIIYLVVTALLIAVIKKRAFTFIGVSAICLYCGAYVPSILTMNFAGRFPLQTFLPVILIAGAYLRFEETMRFNALCICIGVLLVGGYQLDELDRTMTYSTTNYFAGEALGKRLHQFRNRGYTLMVGDIGAISYYADWKSYDMAGLADVTIAHEGLSVEYLSRINPDIIVMFATGPKVTDMRVGDYGWFRQQVIWDYIQESGVYNPIAPVKVSEKYYYIIFMKRRLALYPELKAEITSISESSELMNSRSILEIGIPPRGVFE